jgi:hypothetical protein
MAPLVTVGSPPWTVREPRNPCHGREESPTSPVPARGRRSLRRRRLDGPVRWVAHGEPAEQRSEEYGTEVVALAETRPPREPTRLILT